MPVTRIRRRASALIVATIAAALGLAVGPLDVPRASADDEPGAGQLRVIAAPESGGLLAEGADLSVRITVTNPGEATITGARAELRFAPEAVVDEESVRDWLGLTGVPTGTSDAIAPLVDIGPDGTAVATLTLSADDIDLAETFGVRLLSVAVRTADGVVGVDRTAVVGVPAGGAGSISAITTVVPLTAPEARGRYLTAGQLESLTEPGGALSTALDTGIGRGVVFAVDPRIIASIRLLGDGTPASASEFLTRLEAAPNDSFALRWADADPVATVGLLEVALPAPLGPGTAALTDSAPAANGASPSASPDEPVDPEESDVPDRLTLAELTDWPHSLTGWVWPEPGTLSTAGVSALRAEGASIALLHEMDLTGGDTLLRTIGAGMRAVVADDLAGHTLRAALEGTSRHGRNAAVAELGALLAVADGGAASPPMVILPEREDSVTPQGLGALLDEVIALPWVRGGGLATSTTPAAPTSAAELVEPSDDTARTALVEELLEIEAVDHDFARIAVEPTLLREDRRLDLLAALGIGGESLAVATDAYRERSAELRSAVQVVESNTITLLTDRTSLPVTVQNSLPVAVQVYVRVDAATGQLRVEDQRVSTVVEAGAQTRALIPVQSLVNGEVDITVSVRAEDGAVIGTPIRVELNLQAGWETAGTIAIGAVIAVLFGAGLVRDIRKRRAVRASAATSVATSTELSTDPSTDESTDETSTP